jgi:hypothetical protein
MQRSHFNLHKKNAVFLIPTRWRGNALAMRRRCMIDRDWTPARPEWVPTPARWEPEKKFILL